MEEIYLCSCRRAQRVATPRWSCLAKKCKGAWGRSLTNIYRMDMYSCACHFKLPLWSVAINRHVGLGFFSPESWHLLWDGQSVPPRTLAGALVSKLLLPAWCSATSCTALWSVPTGTRPNLFRIEQPTVGTSQTSMSQSSLVRVRKVCTGNIIGLCLCVLRQCQHLSTNVNISPWLQRVSEDLRRLSQKEGVVFVWCHS